MQRDRSETDQAHFRGFHTLKMPHTLEMCYRAIVSSVCALDTRHVSPSHCRATRCTETRLSSPLSRYTETRLSSPLSRYTETRLSSPLSRYTETRLSSPLSRYTETRLSSPLSRYTETRLSSPLSHYTVTRLFFPLSHYTETRLSFPLSHYIHGARRQTASLVIFPGSSHTSDLKIGAPVDTLPGAWR